MMALVRPLVRFYLKLRHQVFGRRYGRLVLEQVEGLPLVVLPRVSEDALARLADLGAMIAGPVPEMLAHLGLRRFVV